MYRPESPPPPYPLLSHCFLGILVTFKRLHELDDTDPAQGGLTTALGRTALLAGVFCGRPESGSHARLSVSPPSHHSGPSHQQPTEAWQGLLGQQVAGKHLFTSLGIILSLEAEHGLCLVLSQPQGLEVEVSECKRQTPQPGGQAGMVSIHRGCSLVPRGNADTHRFPATSSTCSSAVCASSGGRTARRLSLKESTLRATQPPISGGSTSR